MDQNRSSSSIGLPGAIVIAAAIIAIAIIWVKKPATVQNQAAANNIGQAVQDVTLAPVTAADHILGDPQAPIKIVEFSDPSCPFCKLFNPTMVSIMDKYGPTGKVAWVYRSFPLDKPDAQGNVLHKNANHESQALECAASVGGNTKFWAFEKHLYETTPGVTSATPNGLDQSKLPQLAKDVGIDMVAFNDCLASGQFKSKVEAQYTDGVNAGVTGTPYSFLITPSGNKIPLAGSVPSTKISSMLDALISSLQ